jgi:hypothetical protein
MRALVLAMTLVAARGMSPLAAQEAPADLDLSRADVIELKTEDGRAVLRGNFDTTREPDGDEDRFAALAPVGPDPDAAGEAEVLVSRAGDGRQRQDVKIGVRNVAPNARLTIVVDGREIGVLTANSRGRGDFEVEIGRTP